MEPTAPSWRITQEDSTDISTPADVSTSTDVSTPTGFSTPTSVLDSAAVLGGTPTAERDEQHGGVPVHGRGT